MTRDESLMIAIEWLSEGDSVCYYSVECLCASLFGCVSALERRGIRTSIPYEHCEVEACKEFLDLFDDDIQQEIWEVAATISPQWDALSYQWDDICRLCHQREYDQVFDILQSIAQSH